MCPIIGRQFSIQRQLMELTYGSSGDSIFNDACAQDSIQSVPEPWNTYYLQTARESY